MAERLSNVVLRKEFKIELVERKITPEKFEQTDRTNDSSN